MQFMAKLVKLEKVSNWPQTPKIFAGSCSNKSFCYFAVYKTLLDK